MGRRTLGNFEFILSSFIFFFLQIVFIWVKSRVILTWPNWKIVFELLVVTLSLMDFINKNVPRVTNSVNLRSMSKWQTTPFYCVLENALHTKITSMFYGFYMKFNHSKDVENEVYIVYKVSKQTFGFAHLIARIINICWLRETESLKEAFFDIYHS